MKTKTFNPPTLIQDGVVLGGQAAETTYHNFYSEGNKIRPEELENHGYRLTARHIVIGGYKVFELLPMDSAHGASSSFLAPSHRSSGVIIPRKFTEHKAAVSPLTPRARYAGIGKRKAQMSGVGE
ncbi:MAG TPA: hypothetical protein VG733_13495 [Chthoniobacteraceae bacterium]|nr:hypothetical protein [Chthoniobacteraceae bacterium]